MFSFTQWIDLLLKGHGHKYIKRIPYNTPKGRRYRYIYNVTHSHRGKHAMDESHLIEGTKFMVHTESGKEVHGHITNVSGNNVTYVLDDGPNKGKSVTASKSEIVSMLNEKHNVNEQVQAKRDKLKTDIEQARKTGSEKQVARLESQLKRLGGEEPAKPVNSENLHKFILNETANHLSVANLKKLKRGNYNTVRIHRILRGKNSGEVWNEDYDDLYDLKGSKKLRKLENGIYEAFLYYGTIKNDDLDLNEDVSFVVVNGNVYLGAEQLKFSNENARQFYLNEFAVEYDEQEPESEPEKTIKPRSERAKNELTYREFNALSIQEKLELVGQSMFTNKQLDMLVTLGDEEWTADELAEEVGTKRANSSTIRSLNRKMHDEHTDNYDLILVDRDSDGTTYSLEEDILERYYLDDFDNFVERGILIDADPEKLEQELEQKQIEREMTLREKQQRDEDIKNLQSAIKNTDVMYSLLRMSGDLDENEIAESEAERNKIINELRELGVDLGDTEKLRHENRLNVIERMIRKYPDEQKYKDEKRRIEADMKLI